MFVKTLLLFVMKVYNTYHQSYGIPPPPPPQSLQKINEKVVVVVDYESGRAVPNLQVISKLERALGSPAYPSVVMATVYWVSLYYRCSSERREGWTAKDGWEGAWSYVTCTYVFHSFSSLLLLLFIYLVILIQRICESMRR